MIPFQIESRSVLSRGVFFPAETSVVKERHVWGSTIAGTDAIWNKVRFIQGDLVGFHKELRRVAAEWSPHRDKWPNIDQIKLFDKLPSLRATSLEYWDYTGRAETISREALLAMRSSGSKVGLMRDKGYGFRGIIVRTEEPWSMEGYAMDQLLKYRLMHVCLGRHLNGDVPPEGQLMPTHWPWMLRHAAESDLRSLLNLAWEEYQAEKANLERLNAVIEIENVFRKYVLNTLSWAAHLSHWEHAKMVPFPDSTASLSLWQQDRIENLIYDHIAPWWKEMPKVREVEVTAVRRAYLNTGRVNITLTTNPQLNTLEHPLLDVAHHMISYAGPPYVGVGVPNPVAEQFPFEPFIGMGGKGAQTAWAGHLPVQAAWTVLKEEAGPIPEPRLKVRSRIAAVTKTTGELLEAALASDRPVLIYRPLNKATAPLLCLPRMFFTAQVVPLFGSGRVLKPVREHAKVSGWVTDSIGQPPCQNIFGAPPDGFVQTPVSERSIRDAAVQEILPYS